MEELLDQARKTFVQFSSLNALTTLLWCKCFVDLETLF